MWPTFDLLCFTELQKRIERSHWMLMEWTGIASFSGELCG
jgi:hypothetical protein